MNNNGFRYVKSFKNTEQEKPTRKKRWRSFFTFPEKWFSCRTCQTAKQVTEESATITSCPDPESTTIFHPAINFARTQTPLRRCRREVSVSFDLRLKFDKTIWPNVFVDINRFSNLRRTSTIRSKLRRQNLLDIRPFDVRKVFTTITTSSWRTPRSIGTRRRFSDSRFLDRLRNRIGLEEKASNECWTKNRTTATTTTTTMTLQNYVHCTSQNQWSFLKPSFSREREHKKLRHLNHNNNSNSQTTDRHHDHSLRQSTTPSTGAIANRWWEAKWLHNSNETITTGDKTLHSGTREADGQGLLRYRPPSHGLEATVVRTVRQPSTLFRRCCIPISRKLLSQTTHL